MYNLHRRCFLFAANIFPPSRNHETSNLVLSDFCTFSIFFRLFSHFGKRSNDVKNADFQQFDVEKESPTDWNGDEFCRCEPVVREDGTRGGVKITVVKEFQNHISVNQLIPVPETPKECVLSGVITSETSRLGYLQVKFFKNRRKIRRESSSSNGRGPTPVQLSFTTQGTDAILIQCRVSANKIGDSAVFSDLKLAEIPPGTFGERRITPGIGDVQNSISTDSEPVWQTALPPVYVPEERCLRGSLLMLEEGCDYEISLIFYDFNFEDVLI